VFVYAGWTLHSRRTENTRIVEEAEQQRARTDGEVIDRLGGGKLKILMFYANPPIVAKGDRTLLCYGIAGAKNVRIEPNVEGIGPALSRCVEVFPKATTTYSLVASDGSGAEQKSMIEVRVQ
jgi:hypothetical protein